MNQLTVFSNTVLTMSSLEIAELTGKQHKNVLADIDKMLNELEIQSAEFSADYQDDKGRVYRCYHLPKRETLILVSGYSALLRAKIIDRWQELERANQSVLPDFFNPAAAARAWAEQYELAEKAKRDLAIADGALEHLAESEGAMCLTSAAKGLGITRNLFISWLEFDLNCLFRRGSVLEARAEYAEGGRCWFEHKVGNANGRIYKQVMVTPKGMSKLAQKLAKLALGEAS